MPTSVSSERMDREVHAVTIEKKVTALSDALARLSSAEDLRELLKIIKNPGWTTPAEFVFTTSILDSLESQARSMAEQTRQLVNAARQVGR